MNDVSFTNNKPHFLFFGYGAEYSLSPLFSYMKEQGDQCTEIDMLTHPDVVAELRQIIDKQQPIVLVTSAHLLYDSQNFFYYKTHRKVISVLQLISTLKPVALIYYPHDLKDLIKEEELDYLSLFDLFLSPFKDVHFSDINVPCVNVGWIKNSSVTSSVTTNHFNPSRMVFFTGAYQFYLNLGMDVFYQEYKPLFDAGVAIKLPVWHENQTFETFLKERNVIVYKSTENSIEVMKQNDVVFTQGLSSVGIEACKLGKKVVYIKNSQLDYKNPEQEFNDVGNITYINSPHDIQSLNVNSIPTNQETMSPFDFNKAREAIWNSYYQRTH